MDFLVTHSAYLAALVAAMVAVPPAIVVWLVTAPERRAAMIANVRGCERGAAPAGFGLLCGMLGFLMLAALSAAG